MILKVINWKSINTMQGVEIFVINAVIARRDSKELIIKNTMERSIPRIQAVVNKLWRVNKTHKCPHCSGGFRKSYQLKQHETNCPKLSSKLREHMKKEGRLSTKERLHHCLICGKDFERESDKRRHEKIHDKRNRIGCPGCEKNIFSERGFKEACKQGA